MKTGIVDTHFRKLAYIYTILIISQIVLFAVSYFKVNNEVAVEIISDNALRVFVPLTGIIAMILSKKINDSKISKMIVNYSIKHTLGKYKKYKILQWGIIIIVSIAALVVFTYTKDYFYVIVYLFMIGYLILLRPLRQHIYNLVKN